MAADDLDFTAKYNTELPPEQEQAFQNWTKNQSQKIGRNIANDSYDYDMRGWFAQNGPQDLKAGVHFTDQFKKPNHPTFSTFSQYNGVDDNEGGLWQQEPDKTWSFTPGRTNLQSFGKGELQEYFNRVEPGNKLKISE